MIKAIDFYYKITNLFDGLHAYNFDSIQNGCNVI
jgi:hypothetical protein